MADRMNIKFTIEAVDRFSATMKRLDKQLQSVQNEAKKLDLDRKFDVELETSKAEKNMGELQKRINRLKQTKPKVEITANTSKANTAISKLQKAIEKLGDKEPSIRLKTTQANRELDKLKVKMQGLGNRDTNIEYKSNAPVIIQQLERIKEKLDEIRGKHTVRIDVDTARAKAELARFRGSMETLGNSSSEINLNVNSAGAIAELKRIRQIAENMNSARIRAEINADVARAELERLRLQGNDVRNDLERPIWMIIRGNFLQFRSQMDRLATSVRNFGEVFGGIAKGSAVAFHSILAPAIASTTGAIGSMGVMLGTTAGASMGLLSSVVSAASGFGLFALAGTEVIGTIFGIEKNMKRGSAEWNALSENTRQAVGAIERFQLGYRTMMQSFREPITDMFIVFMNAVNGTLEHFKPIVAAAVEAMGNLVNKFAELTKSDDMHAFFINLQNTVGPAMEAIGGAVMNFMMGFFNLMRAFSPLAADMQAGLLGMSERFRAWSDSLSQSQGFQKFTDYVRTNWPVIKGIFADAINGIIALFVGFAPYAEDWMAKTREMMASFRAFAEGLGQNQQFQEFINYIRENAPKVTQFIGDLIQTLVQMGIAMAPVGAKMIEVASAILQWIINFRQANPAISTFITWLVTLGGAFVAIFAPMMLFGTIIKTTIQVLMRIIPVILRVGLSVLRLAGPIGIAVSLIVGLAIAIYQNWGTIGPWIDNLWNKVKTSFQTVWAALPAIVSAGLSAVVSWVTTKFAQIYTTIQTRLSAAKAIVSSSFNAIKSTASAIMSAVVSTIQSKVANVVAKFTSGFNRARAVVQAAFNAIKSIVSSAIANVVAKVASGVANLVSKFVSGFARARSVVTAAMNVIRSIVSSVISAIVSKVVSGLARMVSAFTSGMNRAKSIVSGAIQAIKGLFNIDLSAQGRKIVQSVANGIKGAIGSVTGAISSVTEKIRNFLPFSPAKEGALRDLDKLNFGGTIAKSISRQTGTVRRAMGTMMEAARPNVDFAVDNAYSGAGGGYASANASRAAARASESRTTVEVPVYLNGREIARASNDEQKRMNAREQARQTQFSRTGGV